MVDEESDDPLAGLQRAVLPAQQRNDDSGSVVDEISIGEEDYANDSFSVGEDEQIGEDDEIDVVDEVSIVAEDDDHPTVAQSIISQRTGAVATDGGRASSDDEDYADESFAEVSKVSKSHSGIDLAELEGSTHPSELSSGDSDSLLNADKAGLTVRTVELGCQQRPTRGMLAAHANLILVLS